MRKNSFIQGALILTIAGIIVKFIGAFSRIYLSRLLGGEGIGLYQMAYPIYLLCLSVSSAGLPVAISIMVAERNAVNDYFGGQKVFRISMIALIMTGVLFSGLLFFGAQWLVDTGIVRDQRAYWSLLALSPAVFCATLLATLRGYFQGLQLMTPTAVSQVLESLIKLFVGIALALYFLKTTGLPELGAAGAILGVSIGSFFAVLYILLYYFRKSRDTRYSPFEPKVSSVGEILKSILTFAVPVIIGSAFLSALDIVDSSVMMYRLQGAAGVDANSAIALKGWLGTARKYFDLPNAVIVPISTIVLPMLSGAIAKKEKREINRISMLSLRMTLMVAIPSAAGLCIFAKPICSLLLYSRPEFAANTAPLLAVMAPAVITASLLYTTNAMIQAVGKVYVPVINMIVGTVVRIGVVYVLCGIPEINAMGSAVGTFVSYLVMIILNLIALHRMLPEIPSVVRMGIRPLLASVIMGAVSYPVYLLLTRFMSEKFAVIPVILLAILVYLVAAVFTKAITREEIVQLPKGKKLADKLHLK